MLSGIDHLMINANDYDKATRFYGWLMPKIGYPHSLTFNEPSPMTGYHGDSGSLWVVSSDKRQSEHTFDKGRVGLRRLPFVPRAAGKSTIWLATSRQTGGVSSIRPGNTIIDPATTRYFSPIPTV